MGELINLSGQILDSQIPDPIARDKETAEAITNHEKATDPHSTAYFNQSTGDARYRQVLSEQTFTASIKNIGLSLGKIGMGGVADNQLVNRSGIEVQAADNSSGAYISLHRPGIWAVHFGLDTNNYLSVGGWSMGANSYRIFHEGTSPLVKAPLTSALATGKILSPLAGTRYPLVRG